MKILVSILLVATVGLVGCDNGSSGGGKQAPGDGLTTQGDRSCNYSFPLEKDPRTLGNFLAFLEGQWQEKSFLSRVPEDAGENVRYAKKGFVSQRDEKTIGFNKVLYGQLLYEHHIAVTEPAKAKSFYLSLPLEGALEKYRVLEILQKDGWCVTQLVRAARRNSTGEKVLFFSSMFQTSIGGKGEKDITQYLQEQSSIRKAEYELVSE